MPDTMQFDLVSPERSLKSGPATAVRLPAAEGDMTAMPGHAPLIATLRPGIVTVSGPDGEEAFAVTGGFAEISAETTTVLAERALLRHPDNREEIEAHLEAARKRAEEAEAADKDTADKFVADMVRLLDDMK